MTLVTRRATGQPSWPVTLIAGMKSAGKSYTCMEASASPLIAQTFWVGFGELDPDDYRVVPGANIDIVTHNGTVPGVIAVINEIADLPQPDDGATLIVLDSGSKVWEAGVEGVKAAKRGPRAESDNDSDLWDAAHGDWQSLMNALRRHNGPSLVTARFEEASVYVGGKPTGEKAWRIKGPRDLPYDVGAVIEMQERGDYTLTGVKSPRMKFDGPRTWPEFTVDALWREMGLADGDVGRSTYTTPVIDQYANLDTSGRDWMGDLDKCKSVAMVARLGIDAANAKANKEVITAIRKKHQTLSPTVR